MNADQHAAYVEGRETASRFCELYPDHNLNSSGSAKRGESLTPEFGCVLRQGVESMIRLAAMPPDTPLGPEGSEFVDRYWRYKDHVDSLPSPESAETDSRTESLLSALEASADGIEHHARSAGVPLDDLLPPTPQPEDEYFARGFVDFLAERKGQ
jgi:hypothetical protein